MLTRLPRFNRGGFFVCVRVDAGFRLFERQATLGWVTECQRKAPDTIFHERVGFRGKVKVEWGIIDQRVLAQIFG